MTERYDCVVLGAGPAGSTAARHLAATGARVLLTDRASFPRDKPCGGGVLLLAAALLPFSLDPVTERVVTGFRMTYRHGRPFMHRYGEPLVLMTQRSRFDAFLAEQAVAAGATFTDGRSATGLEIADDHVAVRLAGGDLATARTVVAADGANGVARRALGMPPLRRAVALEANTGAVPDRWRDVLGLDLGSMPGGYGWVFPKGDHCNVGVGGWPAAGPGLQRSLAAYAASEGFDPGALRDQRGYTLPLSDPAAPVVRGPVAFVGDAAGLIDPLSGEGIGNAIRSAQMAAEAVARFLAGKAPDLAGYQVALEREIEPELAVARQLQALFHQLPWPYVQVLRRSGRFWRSFSRMVRGETTYVGFKGRLGPAALLVDAAAWQAQRSMAARSGWAASEAKASR